MAAQKLYDSLFKILYVSDGPNSGMWDLTSPPYTT